MTPEQEVKLALVEQKMDLLIAKLDEQNLPQRVSSLERWRSFLLGAGAFMGAILGYFGISLTK